MRAIALFSGGKDSTYAIHIAMLQGFEICKLITLIPREESSWLLHRPFAEYTKLQAEAMGLSVAIEHVSGEKEREVDEIRNALAKHVDECRATHLVVGALLSDYQRVRFALIAEDLGLRLFSPLWRKPQEKYLLELVDSGFKVLIVSITAYGIPLRYLGTIITRDVAEDIISRARRYGFNPAFEGGEAETFVIEAPLFRRPICVEGEHVIASNFEGYFKPRRVYLC